MIYFYPELVAKTEEIIKDTRDCLDVLCDLNQIEQAKVNVNLYGEVSSACQLDEKLRKKYLSIDVMNNFAQTRLPSGPQSEKNYSLNEAVISNLNQDYYGILCDTAIKKGIVQEIEQFIKSVK